MNMDGVKAKRMNVNRHSLQLVANSSLAVPYACESVHCAPVTDYYTILYYTILYYTILYHTTLYYTILYYTILYYTILYPHRA